MQTTNTRMILVGDIGGTKTNLAIFSAEAGPYNPLAEKTFSSSQYARLEDIVGEFLGDQVDQPVEAACFGIAGPVIDERVKVTNLPWVIDAEQLRSAIKTEKVFLLNDLQAIAWSIPYLRSQDAQILNPGKSDPEGNIAVIAPGTGLGEAFLTRHDSGYRAYASEGGHTDFAPTGALEIDLLRYLLQKMDHVSYEQVCSGRGIPNLYRFLKDNGYAEPDWLRQQLQEAADPAPVIINTALDKPGSCGICDETLNLFISILASEASNMALKWMATGGVYLSGGIPPRILPALRSPKFMAAFCNKGRFSEWLANIPVRVMLNPKAPLVGATCRTLEKL